jgi:hypothetical protein
VAPPPLGLGLLPQALAAASSLQAPPTPSHATSSCCRRFGPHCTRPSGAAGMGVWDNWRLEGPAFVWHFRGSPHVHVWVNIAGSPSVPTNA